MSQEVSQSSSQPGALSELDFSSTRDFDLANILYIQNIPIVPANKKDELDARIGSINGWLAWELTRVEEAVQGKIKSGDLPKDDSVASKSKRTSYRSKVVTYHRGASPWLSSASTKTQTSTTSAGEDKISLAVARSILGAFGVTTSPQVLNLVKAVGVGFNGLAETVQPHVFYVIDYYHDTVADTIDASIQSFFFNVTVKETSAPAPPTAKGGLFGHDKAVAPPKGKLYEAEIEYIHTSANFDFGLWDGHAPKDQTPYALGKEILVQKQLRLLKD